MWNPNSLAGLPFLADPSHTIFSPFNLLFFIFDNVYSALAWQALFLICITAAGAFYLSKQLKFSHFTSLMVGIFFGFSGSSFESINDINSLLAIALMPWVFGIFIKDVINERKIISWCLALVISLGLVSSHTQYIYYELITIIFAALFLYLRNNLKLSDIKNLLITVFIGFSLSAIQLIPSYELIKETNRQDNIGYENYKGVEFEAVPRYIFPKLFGSFNEGNSWGPNSQHETGLANVNGFLSLSALGLALIALIKRKDQKILILFCVSILWLILSFGNRTFIYGIFYNLLPGFSLFRSPARMLIMYSLGISILAGYGIEYLYHKKISSKAGRVLLTIIVIELILIIADLISGNLIQSTFESLYQIVKHKPIAESAAYNFEKIREISILISKSLIISVVGLMGLYFVIKFKINKYYKVTAITLISLELFLSIRSGLTFVPVNSITGDISTIEFLKNNTSISEKYITTAEIQPYTGIWTYFNHYLAREPFSQSSVTKAEDHTWERLHEELSMIPSNMHLYFNLAASSAYVAIMPKRYRDFFDSKGINRIDFKNYDNQKLNDIGASYFITGIPDDAIKDDKSGRFQKVYEEGRIKIYENKTVKPRAQLLDNTGQEITKVAVLDINPQLVELTVNASQSGTLVLRDFYYPGWIAKVDGQEREIKAYDTLFRGIELEPGKHLVTFEFKPLSFRIGAIISMLSLSGLFGYILISRKNYAKK